MIKRTLTLMAVLALTVTMGCSQLKCAKVEKFMAGGAVIGAAIGGAWGAEAETLLNAGEGAAVGAVTGATAGALVGNMLEEKCEKEELDGLHNEIDSLKSQLKAKEDELAEANKKIADLEAELAKLREQLKTAKIPDLQINLATDVLFISGSARLTKEGKAALDNAAQTLMSAEHKGKFIMVEGHTDAQPIRHSNWKSNWELGSARSLAVLHYLTDKGVDPAMLSAATFSKYQPLATNDTKEGRAQNRRSVIVVYSQWPRAQAAQ